MSSSPYNLPDATPSLSSDDVVRIIQEQMSSFTGKANFLTNGSMQGSLSPQEAYECGQTVQKDGVAAQESDGKIYRTRATAFSTENTETAASNSGSRATFGRKPKLLNISSTVKIWLRAGSGNQGYRNRVVVSPTSSSISSQSGAVVTSNSCNWVDGCTLTSTTALLVYSNSGASTIYAKVLSGLDSGVTLNAETSYSTDVSFNTPIVVAKVSSTKAVVFFRDSTNKNIYAMPVTISGTTVAFGSASVVVAGGASSLDPLCAETFEGSSPTRIALAYHDFTDAWSYVICVEYDGSSTFSSGSSVQLGSSNTIGQNTLHAYLAATSNNSRMAIVYTDNHSFNGVTSSSNFKTALISRAGNTLTLNDTTTLQSLSGWSTLPPWPTIQRISSSYTFIVSCFSGLNTYASYLMVWDGEMALDQVGSALSTDLTSATEKHVPIFVYHSPGRVMMCGSSAANDFGYAKTVDLTTNYSAAIGIAQATRRPTHLNYVSIGGRVSYSGLTSGTAYYADLDGGLTTFALGGTKLIGVADTTGLNIQT